MKYGPLKNNKNNRPTGKNRYPYVKARSVVDCRTLLDKHETTDVSTVEMWTLKQSGAYYM